MNPKVSIITVSYNSEKTIKDTVKSIKKQTYPNIEYIVVDGKSTDSTTSILKKNGAVIDNWISEPDEGIYDAMNKGIQISQGSIIGILNSDDWYEPEAVETAVRAFEEHNDVGLIHGAMNVWSEEGSLHAQYRSKSHMSSSLVSPFHHPTCFVRRSVYQEIGLFSKELPTAADYDFMLRFEKSDLKDKYVDQVLANFRHGGVTTQHTFSLYGQIWTSLRRNGRGRISSGTALLFRGVRDSAVYLIDRLSLDEVREQIRRFLPYHERSISEL